VEVRRAAQAGGLEQGVGTGGAAEVSGEPRQPAAQGGEDGDARGPGGRPGDVDHGERLGAVRGRFEEPAAASSGGSSADLGLVLGQDRDDAARRCPRRAPYGDQDGSGRRVHGDVGAAGELELLGAQARAERGVEQRCERQPDCGVVLTVGPAGERGDLVSGVWAAVGVIVREGLAGREDGDGLLDPADPVPTGPRCPPSGAVGRSGPPVDHVAAQDVVRAGLVRHAPRQSSAVMPRVWQCPACAEEP
jgi:hypothetical protein